MSSPFTGPGANPLTLYLRGERSAIVGIEDDLRDAMADAQRRMNKLESKNGIGAVVRRAQLALVRRELRSVTDDLFRGVNKRIRAAGNAVADAAHEAESVLQRILFRAAGQRESEGLVAAQRAYARRTVATFLARGQNGIGLSQRVYRTRQLSNGFVDRAVNRVILQGGSWQDIATAVKPMIDPSTPGGVSYAAKRLARTELNNAFHTTQKATAEENPFVLGLRWHLSRSHPVPDACDALALGHSKGKTTGVYLPGDLPEKPHPQCLCYTTNEMMKEDDFLDLVTSDAFLDDLEDDYEAKTVALRKKPPTPTPIPQRRSVAQLARQKPADTQRLGGSTAYTDLVTYADGSKLIHKVNGSKATSAGYDAKDITDAEVLGAEMMKAFGVQAPDIHRVSDTELYMEHIDKKLGGNKFGYDESKFPASFMNGPTAKRLGLADYYMIMVDRNPANWFVDGNKPIAIDHGAAWLEGTDENYKASSPFAKWLYDDPAISSDDLKRAEGVLKGLRQKFIKSGHLEWWELSMARHRILVERAKEGRSGLWNDIDRSEDGRSSGQSMAG